MGRGERGAGMGWGGEGRKVGRGRGGAEGGKGKERGGRRVGEGDGRGREGRLRLLWLSGGRSWLEGGAIPEYRRTREHELGA